MREDEYRPWEELGTTRRDAVPDRGRLILCLGIIAAVMGYISSAAFLFFPSVVGLPLSIVVWVMARQDLQEMDAGMMDETGRESTNSGRRLAIAGTVLNAVGILGVALFGATLLL